MSALGSFFPFFPGKKGNFRDLAFDALFQSCLPRLKSIARRLLASERAGHTLQATALVHEAFIKLLRWPCRIDSESHFYRLTERVMKETLIDHARVRNKWIYMSPQTLKGCLRTLTRPEINPELALSLGILMDKLRDMDAGTAAAVQAHVIEGKTWKETARDLGRTISQVRMDVAYGINWLADRLGKMK